MTRACSRWCHLATACGALAVVVCAGRPAAADVFDLQLERLVLPARPGGLADPASEENRRAGALTAYRQVVSELSAALGPRVLTTADTVGYSGFQFAVDYSFTTITNRACTGADAEIRKAECPWQWAVQGTRDGAGNASVPGLIHTLSVLVRKGIWLPLPSFEVGAGATKVMQSDLLAVQVYAKLALHEGFHRWPLPSLAVRGSALRLLGQRQIDLTMAQLDLTLSKSFGILGSATLVPYAGAAWLYSIPRGQVLDLSPDVDAYTRGPGSSDLNNNTVFPASANQDISRWRFFVGARLSYGVFVLTADFMATMCGDFDGTCAPERNKTVDVPDNADTQYSLSLSGGFLF